MPEFALALSVWDIVGVLAYAQLSAFLESALLLGVLIVASVALPTRWFRDRFVEQGALLVFIAIAFALAIHFKSDVLLSWRLVPLLATAYLLANGCVFVAVSRWQWSGTLLRDLGDRLLLLLYVYSFVATISLLVIGVRNL